MGSRISGWILMFQVFASALYASAAVVELMSESPVPWIVGLHVGFACFLALLAIVRAILSLGDEA